MMKDQGAHEIILGALHLQPRKIIDLRNFEGLANKWDRLTEKVKIAMVGKYNGLSDAYLSVIKALQHASLHCDRKLVIEWVDASMLEPAAKVRDFYIYDFFLLLLLLLLLLVLRGRIGSSLFPSCGANNISAMMIGYPAHYEMAICHDEINCPFPIQIFAEQNV